MPERLVNVIGISPTVSVWLSTGPRLTSPGGSSFARYGSHSAGFTGPTMAHRADFRAQLIAWYEARRARQREIPVSSLPEEAGSIGSRITRNIPVNTLTNALSPCKHRICAVGGYADKKSHKTSFYGPAYAVAGCVGDHRCRRCGAGGPGGSPDSDNGGLDRRGSRSPVGSVRRSTVYLELTGVS
jgi:hypothetical protein